MLYIIQMELLSNIKTSKKMLFFHIVIKYYSGNKIIELSYSISLYFFVSEITLLIYAPTSQILV